jgi:DNA-binding winged helix-turn-helix (wHTH) protein
MISTFNFGQINSEIELEKISFRSIGHEFLLMLEDSTSRILPIQKNEHSYRMDIDREFAFEPDLLVLAVYKIYSQYGLTKNYIVEVKKCNSDEIVYSFYSNRQREKGLEPCKLRKLPKDCYQIYFTEVPTKNEQIIDYSLDYKVLISFLMVTILVLLYIILRKKNRKKSVEPKESLRIALGNYVFEPKKLLLTFENQSEELSTKESDLLLYFIQNENSVLERAAILNKVWNGNTTYLGRTLDVHISKLRKRLERDENIQILTVRGVGYKFVITD